MYRFKRNLSKSSPQCDSLLKNKYKILHNIHPATLFVWYASLANGITYQMIKLWVPHNYAYNRWREQMPGNKLQFMTSGSDPTDTSTLRNIGWDRPNYHAILWHPLQLYHSSNYGTFNSWCLDSLWVTYIKNITRVTLYISERCWHNHQKTSGWYQQG